MRILLAANASYVPPRGGATRSNLTWLELLASSGNECRVIAARLADDSRAGQIRDEQIQVVSRGEADSEGVDITLRDGVLVHSAAHPHRRIALLREQIEGFQPDWVLVSSEDLGQVLLREANLRAPGRVVYLAHTPQLFPFGPASWNFNEEGAELVRACAGIVAIGHHTANYIERQLGVRPEVIHPPIYGPPPYEQYDAASRRHITMVNPCGVKGISIFLALARRFPEHPFAALTGWGTTAADVRSLQSAGNVKLLANVGRIGQVLRDTRVLLMPSLWYEGFGLSVMEAMLGGIPVISSDSGGLPEAKLGTGFVLAVRPIERFDPLFDEHGLPTPIIPEQDVGPWAQALETLLSDADLYQEESESSRDKALEFVARIRPGRLEEYLAALTPAAGPEPARPAADPGALSLERRALLAARLRQRRQPPV